MPRGTIVKKISDKGYDFILYENSKKESFFHSTACDGMYNELNEGDEVDFDLCDSPKGPRAENVRLVE